MAVYVSTSSFIEKLRNHHLSVAVVMSLCAAVAYLGLFGLELLPTVMVYQPAYKETPQPTVQTANTNTPPTEGQITNKNTKPATPTHTLPVQLTIPSVGIQTTVQNPNTRKTSVLNRYLRQSAVRYPRSGYPGNGNMFIFGHSSALRTVVNPAYKTFNGLQNVKVGDLVRIQTSSGTFRYRVQSVQFKKDSRAYVPLDTNQDMLTIATCDNFGSKEDRIVVRADFVKYRQG